MWRQVNARNLDESIGRRRKITPIQVAFIVDRYLYNNNFSNTRSTFRNEASSLIDNSSINESLPSLEEMLDEYILLKEQKAILDQERLEVMQEKNRVQMLLQGMQNALNTYNASHMQPSPNVAVMNANFAVVPQPRVCNKTPPGVSTIESTVAAMQNTSNTQSLPKPINTNVDTGNFSTPLISASDKKRKDTEAVNGPTVAKKPRGRPPGRKNQVQGQNTLPQSSNAVNNQVVSQPSSSATQSSFGNCAPSGSQVQGSNVAKGSFNHPPFFVPTNSPIPKTLPQSSNVVNNQVVSQPSSSATQSSYGNCAPSGSQVQGSNVAKGSFNHPPFFVPTNSPIPKTLPQSSNVVNNQVVSQPSSSGTQSSSGNCAPNGSQVQGSNVAKGSFNHPPFFVPTNSPIPKTPPRTYSSHSDTYVSPTKICPDATCNGEASPSCYTMNSTKRVMVGPVTQMAYKENGRCIFPIKADTDKASKKDDARSKLNFDASNVPQSLDKSLSNEVSSSESDKEVDISDIDFSNLMESPLSEMLGICYEDFSDHPGSTLSMDNASRSSHECNANHLTYHQLQASTEKDVNIQGLDMSDCNKI